MQQQAKSLALLKSIPSLKKIGLLILIFFIAGSLFLALMPWQQTAVCQGKVIAYSATERQQNISALVEGRVGKWYVQEGAMVKKGDKIVDIYDNDPAIIENLKNEQRALKLRYQAMEEATKLSQLNVKRQQALFKEGIVSKRTSELAEIEYAKALSEQTSVRAALAQLQIRLSRQYGQVVTAPMDGMILRRMAGEGSTLVKVGEVLAVLLPDTHSRAVELWVNGNDLPLVHQGQAVRLQFEGWPAIQFSGWPSVAVGTFGGIVQVVDNADNGQGLFRVLVTPDPKDPWPDPKYLRQSVRAHGWILLAQVKLGYELWRQFNGFPPSQEKPV